MGTGPSQRGGAAGGRDEEDSQPIIRKNELKRQSSTDTVHCPTCQGTGRIPRGQDGLVAVIPCNDHRLKPRHTKLYVAVSVVLCILASSLVLFFLFPRAVLLSPVAVQSSYVYFLDDYVQINITNVLNITNQNYATVEAFNLSVQALNFDMVVGGVFIPEVASVQLLSVKMYSFVIPIQLKDSGLRSYCQSAALPVHILYLHLQVSMKVYYLAHYEQLSMETYEYIDCGANTTTPHSILPSSV